MKPASWQISCREAVTIMTAVLDQGRIALRYKPSIQASPFQNALDWPPGQAGR